LGQIFDSTFFRVLGAIYAVATLILWVWVATNTVILVWNGSIFEDPSLANVFVRTFVEENQSAEKDPEESPRTGRSATTSITHRP
jgi:hypothetical protein